MSQLIGRPKTSAGSRNSARIKRINNVYERPASRTAMVIEQSKIDKRAPTRAGLISQRIASRDQNRMGIPQESAIAVQNKIEVSPGTPMRPITQQGLTGVRGPSRFGNNRQVIDKSYYMSLIRSKLNNLLSENSLLKNELDKCERDQQNLVIYEKRAEEEANNIQNMQRRLFDCNMIVDRLNRNSDLKEIEEEIVEIKSRNNGAEKTLEELFDERHQKEKIIEELEKEIDQEKVKHKAILDHMDPNLRKLYEKMKENASFIAEEYRLKQQELSELHQNKYEIDKELANSVLKQQAMILHEQLTEIQLKKTKIIAEIDAEETPEQQREQLMKMIVQITEEIAAIQKQVNTVNEKIKQSSEELREFQTEFENLAGEKNEKYHELKIKEAQIDEFLNSYDDTKSELNERIAKLSENIVNLLELISINCEVTNINLNNATDMSQLDNELASAFDLKNLHVSLQEELISLNELEVKLLGEAEKTEQRICEMMKQIEEIDDPRNLKEEIKQRCQILEEQYSNLKYRLPLIEKSNNELFSKLSNFSKLLNSNDEYIKLKNAQKKWQYVEQNNYISREAITAREIETSYQNLKAEVLQLRSDYNKNVISKTQP